METDTPPTGRADPLPAPPRPGALHVLVVENHSDTRHGVRIFLRSLGYQASGVENIAQAIEISEQVHFDVLLSDISLPDGDGWELLAQLEARGRRPAHAIAMSGLGSATDHARSRDAGFELHLVKPFAPEELEQALHRAASRRAAGLASEPSAVPAADLLAPKLDVAQRMHDGLCQHLVAAALWQGMLVRRLEALTPAAPLGDALSEAQQVSRLLDEALGSARALMQEIRAS